MAVDRGQRVPRLSTWLYIAVVAAGIVTLMIMLPAKEMQEDLHIAAWLQQNSSQQKENIRVMVLGTSLTGCGLDSTKVIEKKLNDATGKKVRVLKTWKLNASPETFAGLSQSISMAHPDLVVVESNILFYSFIKNKGWPKYVQRFRDFIFQKDQYYQPDDRPVIVKRADTELERFRSGFVDTSQLGGFHGMLERLAANGSRIILLNFPLESPLESRKWNGADTAAYYRNLRFLGRNISISAERQKELWSNEYYIDHAHLNRKGQQRQTDFFCRIVEAQLNR